MIHKSELTHIRGQATQIRIYIKASILFYAHK